MTDTMADRIKRDIQCFKSVTKEQERQDRIDRRNHILTLVKEYNERLLDGEPEMHVSEMTDLLGWGR